jgi:phosphoadenosine phosphosulfate reductase
MTIERVQPMLLPSEALPALVERACALLRLHQPEGDYYGAFSGGKDSCVIKELARLAGVRVTWHYNVTTIDPPELVRFIKREHPDVQWNKPKHGNFFHRMEKKGFPTRVARWCCDEYKESVAPRGSVMIFGVRAAESPRRKAAWQDVTFHTRTKAWCVSPILSWSDADVWEFIRSRGLPYCSLYDEGFKRLGCIGCPMARAAGKRKEFDRWPKFEVLWRRAFQRIWERRSGSLQRDGRVWFGNVYFTGWEQMWEWWLSNDGLPAKLTDEDEEDSCQTALDMFSGGLDG